MLPAATLLSLAFFSLIKAQSIGTNTAEVHPKLSIGQCAAGGACSTVAGSVVLDSNWRWTHSNTGYTNCYTGNSWSTDLCPDPATCTANCALDGADYVGTYGIHASGSSLKLDFVTGSNVGSRVYLMDENDKNYRLFKLKNQEFAFDVDVSQLPCGLNGALYMVAMDADGGVSKYPTNKAGAAYGTGYCDTQCPHDIKWINGEANSGNWTGTDANSGAGHFGSCCIEMDIWEANSISTALTPHVCSVQGQERCEGTECGDTDAGQRYDGICDKDGCDYNSFRLGDTSFYGPNMAGVDTTRPVTVVTQFITSDNTATGDLVEIRRKYVQNGVVIGDAPTQNLPTQFDSITDDFCAAQKTTFGDTNAFASLGGLKTMGDALDTGLVLVMSLWDDSSVSMLWLDSDYPTTDPVSQPGVSRGTCSTSSGKPADVRANSPGASVTFSNIKFGPIGSTFSGTPASSGSSSVVASSASSTRITTTTRVATASPTTTTVKPTTTTAAPVTTTTSKSAPVVTTTSKSASVTTSKVAPVASSSSDLIGSCGAAPTTTSSSSTATGVSTPWGQCGGNAYTGPTACPSGWSCVFSNDWYSQCLQSA